MIAFLVGSTMWQYNQFQSNVKNLQFGLPQELAQGMPDTGQQISDIMAQVQSQMQNPTQTGTAENNAELIETKTYTAPDNAFTFEYGAGWTQIDLGGKALESNNGKILFSAYKISSQTSIPSTNSLTVEESNIETVEEITEKIESDLRAKNISAKITRSEIIKGTQTIPVMETGYSYTAPVINTQIILKNTFAVIIVKEKIYVITVTSQNDNEESDTILKSVIINSESATEK